MEEVIFMKDFYEEEEKLDNIPFLYRNILDKIDYDDPQELILALKRYYIMYDSIYFDEIKDSKFIRESTGLRYFENILRLNPIIEYECFQFFRKEEVFFYIKSDLLNYHSEIMLKISFQFNQKYKHKLLQKEINKILKETDRSGNTFAISLLYNSQSRSDLLGERGRYEVISEYIANKNDFDESDHNKPSQNLTNILLYVSNKNNDPSQMPLISNLKEWRNFEIAHYKLLYLRRLYKSIDLFNDFFNVRDIEISEPGFLSNEDSLFANKIKFLFKKENDVTFILNLLRNEKERSVPFFHNLYQYLANSNKRVTRFKVLGAADYIRIVKNCYPEFIDFSISSNTISVKWESLFMMYDKK